MLVVLLGMATVASAGAVTNFEAWPDGTVSGTTWIGLGAQPVSQVQGVETVANPGEKKLFLYPRA